MNLFLLIEKRDKTVATTDAVKLNMRRIAGDMWRGLDIAPGEAAQVRIRGATALHPFRDRPECVGWHLFMPGQPIRFLRPGGRACVQTAFTAQDETAPVSPPATLNVGAGALMPLRLPWRIDAPARQTGPLDLTLHVTAQSSAPVFLAVHRALDRAPLLALCKGRGIEIGPGPKPQVLPARDVEVTYIEQMTPEEWRRLYDPKQSIGVDESLWDRYRVGDAHDLPVEDGSLDFIFSSHVFEHLANPLRHLEIWGSKLRKGGRVVAIVPDLAGAKDYAGRLSDMSEFRAEYERGDMAPDAAHYARYAALRAIKDGGRDMMASRRSIHVHFYTHANMAGLLEDATARFGFEGYSIEHTPNHKDFHFTVVR